MRNPQEVTPGLGDLIKKGLDIFGRGVESVSAVLRSGDTAFKQVDGALQGNPNPAAPAAPQVAASEEQLANQVTALIREGGRETGATGNPQSSGPVSRFQEALRSLFQLPLTGAWQGLGDMLPAPADMLSSGLRDLRGSMALVRLANGTGTLGDVQEVANYADVVVNRVQSLHMPVAAPPPPPVAATPPPAPPASAAPAASPSAARTRRKRSPKASKTETSQPARTSRSRRKKPDPGEAAFAMAVAEELGDAQVKTWAQEYSDGKMTEAQWMQRHTEHAAATMDSLDEVYGKAAARVQGSQ